jgi:hypothetical protein
LDFASTADLLRPWGVTPVGVRLRGRVLVNPEPTFSMSGAKGVVVLASDASAARLALERD